MKQVRLACCFCVLQVCQPLNSVLHCQADTGRATSQRQQIVVKIRNAQTGLPVWLASPYVFLGKTEPARFPESHRKTRLWNDAHVGVDGASPREARVWIDFLRRDCRYADGGSQFRTFDLVGNTLNDTPAYSLDTILSEGIVAPNFCTSRTQRPEPGVLTIYVIPENFKDLWDE
jgi:hypothetical protein